MNTIRSYFRQIDDKKLRLIFYISWLLLNLFQAGFTNLLFDEAYYWVISGKPGWGHFYYPPLTDLLIRAGYFLLPDELGVRLFFVLLSTAGILLMEKLLRRDDLRLYYALMLSIVFFQVIGILAAPDIPLFFLSVTFYLLFRKFLEKESWLYTVLLAVNSALLLYTKYHGILLIGFTFIWNLSYLLKRRKTVVLVLLAVLLFVPHILWQIRSGFPTVRFHLFERPGGGLFEWKNILDYIPGQLLFAGPLVSIPVFLSLIRLKREGRFEGTMFFNLLAMYLFFLLISLYHHVEVNWTVIGIVPLVVLSHKALSEQEKLKKWIFRLLPYSILLALLFRTLLLFPQLAEKTRIGDELYGYREWAAQIREKASRHPVVFTERYQRTSQYAFYSGDPTYTLNPTQKSDYDYLGLEEELQGDTVLVVSRRQLSKNMDSIQTVKGIWYLYLLPDFRSYKNFRFSPEKDPVTEGDSLFLTLKPENPYPYPVTFSENPEMPVYLGYRLYDKGELISWKTRYASAADFADGGTLILALEDLPQGEYELVLTLRSGWLPEYPASRIFRFLR